MFARIAFFARKIDEAWRPCFLHAQAQGKTVYPLLERLFAAKVQLDQAIKELQKACHTGTEVRLRDACATLVQVYTAYTPDPDLHWLGCPEGWPATLAPMIRLVIRPPGEIVQIVPISPGCGRVVDRQPVRLCRPDVVQGIAGALAVVAAIARRPDETEEWIDSLRQERRLVLVDLRPRRVYWDDKLVDADWDRYPALWDVLWPLAFFARRRQSVHWEDLIPPGRSGSAVKTRRSRLSKFIPGTLDILIEDVRPGGYRLVLTPEEIALVQLDHEEQLVEVGLDARAPRG